MDDVATFLNQLNSAQFGSLGEFLFVTVVMKKQVEPIRKQYSDRVDFVVGDVAVDVKTTKRGIHQAVKPIKPYAGLKTDGIRYAQVEFFSTGVRVSLDMLELDFLEPENVSQLLREWRAQRKNEYDNRPNVAKKKALEPIYGETRDYFQSHGRDARIIYRTVQKGFGKESPHNLKPDEVIENAVTVYLDFRDERISRENINRIYAFPDNLSKELPMLDRPTLHRPKVDLRRMPLHFVFQDLDDLKQRFPFEKPGA